MTWTDAFTGIPYWVRSGAEMAQMAQTTDDLAATLQRRVRGRLSPDTVRVPIASLYDVARRIEAQSARIAALEGSGPPLDAEALAAYEADQKAAEERAARTGIYVRDAANDRAALYGRDGDLVIASVVSSVVDMIHEDGWTISSFDADGMFDGGFGKVPETLPEFQKAYGRFLRDKRAAEVAAARAPEEPIT